MICRICKKNKNRDSYYPSDLNYKHHICKKCKNAIDRKRYPQRKKYLRDYWIKWYAKEENKKSHSLNSRKYADAWSKKHRKEVKIGGRLRYAVAQGRIIKPDRCSHCKRSGKVEAHHPNYDKVYEVVWVCRSCHKLFC